MKPVFRVFRNEGFDGLMSGLYMYTQNPGFNRINDKESIDQMEKGETIPFLLN